MELDQLALMMKKLEMVLVLWNYTIVRTVVKPRGFQDITILGNCCLGEKADVENGPTVFLCSVDL
jgi:hypothetical protein